MAALFNFVQVCRAIWLSQGFMRLFPLLSNPFSSRPGSILMSMSNVSSGLKAWILYKRSILGQSAFCVWLDFMWHWELRKWAFLSKMFDRASTYAGLSNLVPMPCVPPYCPHEIACKFQYFRIQRTSTRKTVKKTLCLKEKKFSMFKICLSTYCIYIYI